MKAKALHSLHIHILHIFKHKRLNKVKSYFTLHNLVGHVVWSLLYDVRKDKDFMWWLCFTKQWLVNFFLFLPSFLRFLRASMQAVSFSLLNWILTSSEHILTANNDRWVVTRINLCICTFVLEILKGNGLCWRVYEFEFELESSLQTLAIRS